jgi:hypothetical protein
VPEKRWRFTLKEGVRGHVRVITRKGQLVTFAVVLVAEIKGIPVCVSRYDTAHGQAHQDILGLKEGLIRKDWLMDLTNKEALDYAIEDFRSHYEKYIQVFLAH